MVNPVWVGLCRAIPSALSTGEGAVSTSGIDVPAIRADRHSANRTAVAFEAGERLAVCRSPQAHRLVSPTRGDDTTVSRKGDAQHWLPVALQIQKRSVSPGRRDWSPASATHLLTPLKATACSGPASGQGHP